MDPFNAESFQQRIESQSQLIRQYAVAEVQGYTFLGASVSLAFDQATAVLKLHVVSRNNAVASFPGK